MSALTDMGKAQRRIEKWAIENPDYKPRDLGQLVLDVAVNFDLPAKAYFILDAWTRRTYLEKFR